ncbi:MAG: glutamine synthetase [Actinobacteria bacterium]|nr:glutamine synthetase [Actinomycetota bacterium]
MSLPDITRNNSLDPGAVQPLEKGVEVVRVIFPDLHGIARGKDVPARVYENLDHGLSFCSAVMATDLRHTPVLGGESGYPDMVATPEPASLVRLPWEPEVACCMADLQSVRDGAPVPDPRRLLRSVVAEYEELGLSPVVGPELEFFLLAPEDANGDLVRRIDLPSMVYTVGPQVDPDGFVRRLGQHLTTAGLPVVTMNHEYMNSQYEINLRHADALTAADQAFLLRNWSRDIAALQGLRATFAGKPFNDQGGSGFHIHVSLDREGENAFDDDDDANGVSDLLRCFAAGVLEHAAATMAFLNPTINAYRRLVPDSLAPTRVNWGWDNRSTMLRIPAERGRATRIEVRVGDASANAHLAIAAILIAGLDGIRNRLELNPPAYGDAYRTDSDGEHLPRSLEESLVALGEDAVLADVCGPELIETFVAIKQFEVERHRAWVSDWERTEYLMHI